MVRQARAYFAAAVSAAALNAAAVAAFVLLTLLASVPGFPLRGVIGFGEPAAAPPDRSSSSVGAASAGSLVDVISDSLASLGPADSPTAAPPGATTKVDGGVGGDGGDTPGSSGPGAAGSPGSNGGPGGGGGGAPDLPGAPELPGGPGVPGPAGETVEQVGGAVASLPSRVNDMVGSTVDSADSALGGSLVSQTVHGASGALLGPGSTADQAAGEVGGAVQELGAG